MSIGYEDETLFSFIGKIVPIDVEYYSGWSFIPSESRCEKLTKELEVYILGKTDDNNGVYGFFPKAQFFSWGNGPTLPQNLFVLKINNEISFCDKQQRVHNWSNYIPKWKFTASG